MRSPHLYDTLRRFCLGAFAVFHGTGQRRTSRSRSRSTARTDGRRSTSTARSCAASSRRAPSGCCARDDVRDALADLAARAGGAIFARAYEGMPTSARVYRTVLVPLLVRTAEGCGGFDWDDAAFDRAYEELEALALRRRPRVRRGRAARRHLVRRRRSSSATASACAPTRDRRARGDVARGGGAAAARLRPRGRPAVRARARAVARAGDDEVPDAPGELADAVTAIRLATAAPVAAGPVLFERLDWRPFGIRPVLPIAATRAARRADAARPVPRARSAAKLRPAARARRRRRAPRRRARPLGARRSSRTTRSAASSSGMRSTRALGDGDGTWAAAMRARRAARRDRRGARRSRRAVPHADAGSRAAHARRDAPARRPRARSCASSTRSLLGLRAGHARVAELRAS